jgi:hypothetical protein
MDSDAGTTFCSDNKKAAPDSPKKLLVKVSVTARPSLRTMDAEALVLTVTAAMEVKYTDAVDAVAGTTNTVPLARVIAADEELDTVTVAVAAVRALGWYPIIRANARTDALWVAVSK